MISQFSGLLSKWLPKALLTDTLLEERLAPQNCHTCSKSALPLMGPRVTNLALCNPEPLTSTDGGHIRVRFPLPVLGSPGKAAQPLTARFPRTCNWVSSDDNRETRNRWQIDSESTYLDTRDSSCVSGLVTHDQVRLQGRVKGQASLHAWYKHQGPKAGAGPSPSRATLLRVAQLQRPDTGKLHEPPWTWAQAAAATLCSLLRGELNRTQRVATLLETTFAKVTEKWGTCVATWEVCMEQPGAASTMAFRNSREARLKHGKAAV